MIRMAVNNVEPGMVLAAPIPHPADASRVLLNTGFEFDAFTLKKLNRWPVFTVWIAHPGFEFLDHRLRSAIPEYRVKLYDSIKQSFTGIAKRVAGSFDIGEYRNLVSSMIMAMVSEKAHAVWAERIMEGETELFGHSANVAYLALVIGMRLKRYIGAERNYVHGANAEDLTNLGIGAMFHDFGKLNMKRRVHREHVCDPHSNEEEYRRHPEAGFRALQGRLDATAAAVALHHHQQFDGHGFPQLKQKFIEREQKQFEGHSIHIFARVVAVANVLEAMVSSCQKRNRPTVAALAAIHKPQFESMFDPTILNAALRSIPPFPLGSCVCLSDGREAVVTDLNSKRPWRPKLRVLIRQGHGHDEPGEEIDLTATDAPSIASEGGRSVSKYITFLDSLHADNPEPARTG